MDLQDQLVVVTGGASGIGEACARRFAKDGARVVIADRNLDGATALAAELRGEAVAIDVGDEDSVRRAAATIEAQFGPVDVLVNSAGVLQRTLPPGKLPVDCGYLVATPWAGYGGLREPASPP